MRGMKKIAVALLSLVLMLGCLSVGTFATDVADTGIVAKIGEQGYTTLEAAIAAANEMAEESVTIALQSNVTLQANSYPTITKALTIDGGNGNYTIDMNGNTLVPSATFTMQNVNVINPNTWGVIQIKVGDSFSVKMQNVSVTKISGYVVSGYGQDVTLIDCDLDATDHTSNRTTFAVISLDKMLGKITIENTSLTGFAAELRYWNTADDTQSMNYVMSEETLQLFFAASNAMRTPATLYQDITLTQDLSTAGAGSASGIIIPEGKTLTVANGATLTADKTITVNGTLLNNGTVMNSVTVINNGSIAGANAIHGLVSGSGSYSNGAVQLGDCYYLDLNSAVAAAAEGATIQLHQDITVASGNVANNSGVINLTKSITIEGNKHTITVTDTCTTSNTFSFFNVTGGTASLKNFTLVMSGENTHVKHGINYYLTSGTVENVTVQNFYGAGMVVNGASVTATNFHTAGNGWGGVNVGKGSGVSTDPAFVLVSGSMAEATQIWADNVDTSLPTTAYVVAPTNWAVTSSVTDAGKTVLVWRYVAPVATATPSTSTGATVVVVPEATVTPVATVKPTASASANAAPEATATPVQNSGIDFTLETEKTLAVEDVVAQQDTVVALNRVDVTVPLAVAQELLDQEATALTVQDEEISVSFDAAALQSISEQANSDVRIVAQKAPLASLSQEAQEKLNASLVFELKVVNGSLEAISNFGEGRVTIQIPYVLEDGEDAENLTVYYINALGELEEMLDAYYDAQTSSLIFTTNHFSYYAVGVKQVVQLEAEEPVVEEVLVPEEVVETASNHGIVFAVVGVVLLLLVLGAVVYLRRKKD